MFGKEKIMKIDIKKQSPIIVLKSTDNTDSIKAVLNFYKQDKKILFLANKNTSFLKDSLEKLQHGMHNFETIYKQVQCMFLKSELGLLNKVHGQSSFIVEIESLLKDEQFSTLYFHRLDTLIECMSLHDCKYLISKIVNAARRNSKKVIFSINHKTTLGKTLESILSSVATQIYTIERDHNPTESKLILLNAKNDTYLVKSALDFYQKNTNILLLASQVTSSLKNNFKKLQKDLSNFDEIYAHINFMFLKDSWTILDNIYGKPFFTYEIQKLMKNQKFSTLYFHRLDMLFSSASEEDCIQLISDIRDFARYYQKKVLFSIDEKTEFGQILKPILLDIVDYENMIEEPKQEDTKIFSHVPVNLILQNKNRRISL
jgi:hypothetical protein